ncbi:hypothetical protein [Tenacibaculum xiamenense]
MRAKFFIQNGVKIVFLEIVLLNGREVTIAKNNNRKQAKNAQKYYLTIW